MAMDPVSRRLAAAAMGLAFGLSRDEELEKTRLDLERARMEREDFRNGAGPQTWFMHAEVVRPGPMTVGYNEWMSANKITMRESSKLELELYKKVSRSHNEISAELSGARTLLARVAREHLRKKRKLNDPIINGIVEHFRKAHIDDDGVGEYANDDLGDVSIGLPVWIDEDSDSTASDE